MPIDTSRPVVVVDLETSDLTGKLIWCVGLAYTDHVTCVEWDEVRTPALLTALFTEMTPIFHNAKFDVRVLREHGVVIEPGSYWDTVIMSYVWNPRREHGHSLASWGRELRYTKVDYRQACIDAGLLDAAAQVGTEHLLPYDNLKRDYCMRDCAVTMKLYQHLHTKLVSDPRAYQLLVEIELPMIDCLIEMEQTGFYVDKPASLAMVETLTTACADLRLQMSALMPFVRGKEIVYARGMHKRNGVVFYNRCELQDFNPNSNSQIADALTRLYGWEPEKHTPSGAPCTDTDTLEGLPYPLARVLVEYSTVNKMHGMVSGYLTHLGSGRRLHGNFNQVVTKTGRLSSSDPNLQNIPSNGVWGAQMRALFVCPGDGWKLVGCDLSNIEARMLAHYLSLEFNEKRMADTFAAGIDFHQSNADSWGLTRREAKTVLYGLLYGAGSTKLGNGDSARGQAMIDSVYTGMPAIKQLKELMWQRCADNDGILHDVFGRRLYYPEITASGSMATAARMSNEEGKTRKQVAKGLIAQAQRRVFNALLQGSSASLLKRLVLMVFAYQHEYDAYLVANIHDEALYYVPADTADAFAARLTATFSTPLLSHCPIAGEAKIGNSWHDVH